MAGYADVLNARRGDVPTGPPTPRPLAVKPLTLRKPPVPRVRGGKAKCPKCGHSY